jgi:hypothetical protein
MTSGSVGLDDEPVILVRRGEDLLAEGLVVEDAVRCPWVSRFSLRTGEALRAPALNPVAIYEVWCHDGLVFVSGKLDQPSSVRRRVRRRAAPTSVAIVGAGGAGNSAAEELRHLGFAGDITLIDCDAQAPYDRPNLSKDYLAGKAREERMPLHPQAYYEELRIGLLLGRTVTRLDATGKRLTLDDSATRPVRCNRACDGRRTGAPCAGWRQRPADLLPPHPEEEPCPHQGGRGRRIAPIGPSTRQPCSSPISSAKLITNPSGVRDFEVAFSPFGIPQRGERETLVDKSAAKGIDPTNTENHAIGSTTRGVGCVAKVNRACASAQRCEWRLRSSVRNVEAKGLVKRH